MSMSKLLTVEESKRYCTCPGDPIHKLFVGKVDEAGRIKLVENGEENIQEKINSYAESCDMQVIIRRFLNGEVDVLSQVQGFYGDITDMPKTYAEFMQKQIDAKRIFESMPADVRQKFGNDIGVFMQTAGDDDWFEKIGVKRKDVVSSSADQVRAHEQTPSEGVSK